MSQLLVEPEVKQLKPSQILRTTTVGQTTKSYARDGKFCAMGAIMNYFGWDGTASYLFYNAVGFKSLGISDDIWGKVVDLNDNCGKSFIEIADWLEERGL